MHVSIRRYGLLTRAGREGAAGSAGRLHPYHTRSTRILGLLRAE
jgi:hypothetical protein